MNGANYTRYDDADSRCHRVPRVGVGDIENPKCSERVPIQHYLKSRWSGHCRSDKALDSSAMPSLLNCVFFSGFCSGALILSSYKKLLRNLFLISQWIIWEECNLWRRWCSCWSLCFAWQIPSMTRNLPLPLIGWAALHLMSSIPSRATSAMELWGTATMTMGSL